MISRRVWALSQGSATVEFTFLVIAMLLPFSWLVSSLFAIHTAALALDDAARQSARAFALADSVASADAAGRALASQVLVGHRVSESAVTVEFLCRPNCLEPGGVVTSRVAGSVPLPLIPVGWGAPFGLELSAIHMEQIDFYRDRPD